MKRPRKSACARATCSSRSPPSSGPRARRSGRRPTPWCADAIRSVQPCCESRRCPPISPLGSTGSGWWSCPAASASKRRWTPPGCAPRSVGRGPGRRRRASASVSRGGGGGTKTARDSRARPPDRCRTFRCAGPAQPSRGPRSRRTRACGPPSSRTARRRSSARTRGRPGLGPRLGPATTTSPRLAPGAGRTSQRWAAGGPPTGR
mmetsp:Transcript_97815/g.254928  ORF Transcript_97815/g.254928 Transcript_97815/m.254928 type:complete len:205 (+) Transcript_97815:520-1134(+)